MCEVPKSCVQFHTTPVNTDERTTDSGTFNVPFAVFQSTPVITDERTAHDGGWWRWFLVFQSTPVITDERTRDTCKYKTS